MFNGYLSIAIAFIEIAAVVVALSLGACIFLKMRNRKAKRKKENVMKKYGAYFAYVQSHLDESAKLRVPAAQLRRPELRVFQTQLSEWIECLEGSHRDKLTQLCEELGLVAWNLKRLESAWSGKRIEAAYYLGMMRSKQAAPRLLTLMEKQRSGPALYIVARAAVKCAGSESDIRKIIGILLKRGKPAHRLTADVLQDASIDLSNLFAEWLEEQSSDAVQIALFCLQGRSNAHLLGPLKKLSNLEHDMAEAYAYDNTAEVRAI